VSKASKTVTFAKTAKGLVAIVIRAGSRRVLPVDLLGIAVGRDAWLRGVKVPCAGCGALTSARDLSASTLCPTCYDRGPCAACGSTKGVVAGFCPGCH